MKEQVLDFLRDDNKIRMIFVEEFLFYFNFSYFCVPELKNEN